jgi:hypothetical protein
MGTSARTGRLQVHTTRTYIHPCMHCFEDNPQRPQPHHWYRRMVHHTSPGLGMHHYQFPTNTLPCKGDDCRTDNAANPRNYFACKNCTTLAWFNSQCLTLCLDDAQRASTAKRFKMKHPLPLHPKVADAHKAFRTKGGRITLLTKKKDLPTIVWVDDTHHVSRVQYPSHVLTHKM